MTTLTKPSLTAQIRIVPRPWKSEEGLDTDGFLAAVSTAEAIELRKQNDLLSNDDARRYHMATQNIERHARTHGKIGCQLSVTELEELQEALTSTSCGATNTYYPPWKIQECLKAYEASGFINHATATFAAAMNEDAGCVITIEPGSLLPQSTKKADRQSVVARYPEAADAIAQITNAPECFSSDRRRAKLYLNFMAEIEQALRFGQPVMVGAGVSHDVITEALQTLSNAQIPIGKLRIIYVDGSETEPFTTGCEMARKADWGRTVRLGMISMRHSELDNEISGYVFRNRMVSLSRLQAETEADCQRQATSLFGELTAEGISCLEVIHTGFEVAAIGLYRAVINWNSNAENKPIAIRPVYLTSKGYINGTDWGTR